MNESSAGLSKPLFLPWHGDICVGTSSNNGPRNSVVELNTRYLLYTRYTVNSVLD